MQIKIVKANFLKSNLMLKVLVILVGDMTFNGFESMCKW
jgi:hypothetical protein